MEKAWIVVLTGIIIVFTTLLLLILVFTLFGKTMERLTGKKREKKESSTPAASTASGVVKPVVKNPPAVQAGIPGEVVAAISAAISAYEGAGASFVIRSIRRQKTTSGRPVWARTGIADNTRPF